jgi:hypothetical protein
LAEGLVQSFWQAAAGSSLFPADANCALRPLFLEQGKLLPGKYYLAWPESKKAAKLLLLLQPSVRPF